MPGLYGNVGNTTVSGGNTTGLYNTGTAVTISNNINCQDINASGNLFVAGTGTFGGTVTAPTFVGNLTGNVTGNISGNVTAPGSNTEVIYNDNGVLGGDADFTWNETTNVLTVNGNVTATGNVSGNYILGNGSQLTGLPATYGNANVADFLDSLGSNAIVTTGNVTAGFFIGNGSQLTGIVSSYGNANVAAFLPTYTGNLAGGNLDIGNNATINNNLTVGGTIFGTFSGNISGNLVVPGANTEIIFNNSGNAGASADFTFNDATNVMTVNGTANVGVLNATGNITGAYIFGNGSQLTGLPATYSDANVTSLMANFGSNVIVTTGNITGGNFIGNGQYLTNLPGANVTGTVANATYATSAGSATTATHATTANTVTDAAQGNITSLGTLTGLTVNGDQNITGNLVVGQNLTVNGNTIQVNITELNVQDPIIGLGRGENNAPLTSNDGKDRGEQLWYYTSSEKSAFTGYDNSSGNLIMATDVSIANEIVTVNAYGTTEVGDLYAQGNITGDYVFGNAAFMTGIPAQYGDSNVTTLLAAFGSNAISTTGNVTAGYFFGDGSGLTNINAGNITGAYGNANVANFLANYGSNTLITTGNVSGGNVIGTFLYGDGSNITGVVAGAASTRIAVKNTSGGTITKGTPVYATGTVGASTIIEIAASRADTPATMPCLGLLAQDLNANDQGYAISVGTLTGSNTNAFVTGRELYVAAAGGLTTSRPTGTNVVQTLGFVGRVDSTNGSIEVNVWNINGLPNLGNGNVWIGNANGFPTQQVAYGDANVAAYLPTYTGNLAGGNITVTGVYYGNGSGLTSLTGANVTGTVANATYATSAGSAGTATTAVTVTGNAQANITSVGTLTTLTVSGNIGTGGILTDNYYYANGTPISFGGTYGNANVSNFLANGFGSNTITTTGNVQTGNLLVTGSLSNPTGNAVISDTLEVSGTITGNVNVGASALALFNYDPSGSGLSITAGNANYSGGAFNVVTVTSLENHTLFNLGSPGNVTTRGNIRAGNVTYTNTDGTAGQVLTTYGNGITYFSTVSGGTYGNANVSNFLANGFGSNTITTTGNVTAGNISTTGNISIANSGKIDIGTVTLTNNGVAPASLNINGSLEIQDVTIFNGDLKIQDGNGVNFYDSDNTNYVGLRGPGVVATDIEFVLPDTYGSNAQVLTSNGAGGLSWTTVGLSGNMTGNINGQGFNIGNVSNVSISNSGNLTIGTVSLTNNSVGPPGLNITGSVEIQDVTIFNGDLKIQDGNGVNFYDSDNTNYVGLKGPAVVAADQEWTLPAADGTSAQALSTYGNGQLYWQTVGSGSYGNANVSNFLANGFGSNTIVTTGNIDANNFNATTSVRVTGSAGNISGANYVIANYFSGNGSQLTGINSFATIDANGTSIVADSISDTLTLVAGSGVTITGNATSDSITIAATGGGGSPGGSDTQIQFNDGGSFGGNAQMTFNKTTGNVAFGNLVIQTTNPNSAAVITNLNTLDATARPLLDRIAIGAGFDGDFGNTGDYLNISRNSAVTVMNRWNQSSASNSVPMIGQSAVTWFNNTAGANITSGGNARGLEINTFYTGANRWGTQGTTNTAVYNGLRSVAVGGNGVSGGSVGTLVGASITAGTNSNNAVIGDNIGILSNQFAGVSGGNNGNVYGLTFNMNSSNPTVGNVYLLHNQVSGSATHNGNWGLGGNFRSASRYYMLRNDDDVAQVKLGSLRQYHEFLGNATQSTSSITIGPRQGPFSQVVRTTPTQAITSVTFTGFITSASDGVNTDFQADTMTWIIKQGATPYAVTLPTGNSAISYAGGVTTVGTTANATTMVAVTAYDNAGTTNYLVTVSPEFQQV